MSRSSTRRRRSTLQRRRRRRASRRATCWPASTGPARAVLRAERVALNLVQRMTGIATLTARYVDAVAGHARAHRRHPQDDAGAARPRAPRGARRRRPQPPLLAVRRRAREGQPPRRAARGIGARSADGPAACARRLSHTTHLEVEVDRLDQIEAVLAGGVDTIMLDNFSPRRTARGRRAGRRARARRGQRRREPRHRRARSPRPGVDVISVGALTHSVRALDLGLDVDGRGAAAMIYLDHAPPRPVRREVLEAMWPYLTGDFGNPSSHHDGGGGRGAGPRRMPAREVAAVLGCPARRGRLHLGRHRGGQPRDQGHRAGDAARPPRRDLADRARGGARVGRLPAAVPRLRGHRAAGRRRRPGRRPTRSRAALRDDTALVSIGTPTTRSARSSRSPSSPPSPAQRGVPFHTDAVQAAGWLPTRLDELGVDALSISGHKLGAPKGVGALWPSRGGLPLEPLLHGGGQERGRRSGTENVAGAVGLGDGARLLRGASREARAAVAVAGARRASSPGCSSRAGGRLTGSRGTAAARRTPRSASPAPAARRCCSSSNAAASCRSSGSACAAGSDEPSHVLLALGIPPEVAQTAVRFTFDADVTDEAVDGPPTSSTSP